MNLSFHCELHQSEHKPETNIAMKPEDIITVSS